MADPAATPIPPFPIPDHELIRPIGRGSYGEVWLARNVFGEFRAVKIVRRDSFDRDRPVEREFEGIRKFEPVSRSHESQVHILHAGRHADGFYYVMELADDANAPAGEQGSGHPNWECYAPKTLRSEMQRRGRLPFDECLGIARQLASGLAHLHGHRLVHRDIKPSNIIFVHGQTKLADIGLVAPSDATMSFVGTEGFLPPEGPGRPQADIYSLGKVLYEMSTGRDRNDFPELPTALREDPQRQAFEEFNEVVLKACEPNPRQRYQSAEQMLADLELLRAGKSLQKKRSRERAWAIGWKSAALVALAAGIWLAAASIRPGERTQAPRQPLPVRLAVDYPGFWRVPGMPRQFDFSPDGEHIVFAREKDIFLWDRKTTITRRLELHGTDGWLPAGNNGSVAMPRWAPNSREFLFQALRVIGGPPEGPIFAYALFLVSADTGDARQIGPEVAEDDRTAGLCWRPDGNGFTCKLRPNRFVTVALTGERTAWKDSGLPGGRGGSLGDYSPDGAWLAVSSGSGSEPENHDLDTDIWLVPHLGGPAVRLTQRPGADACPTWSPDGESVYFVSEGMKRRSETQGLWKVNVDLRTGLPAGPVTEVLVRRGSKFLHPKFVAGGRSLAFAAQDPDSRIWTGQSAAIDKATEVIRGRDPVLSPDGNTVYFVGEQSDQRGAFAISRTGTSASLRKVTSLSPMGTGFTSSGLSLSPDGEQLAIFSNDGKRSGIFLVPAAGGEPRLLQELPARDALVPVWSPDGKWLAYAAGDQLSRVSHDGETRELLATVTGWAEYSIRWSPDGSHLAGFAYARPEDGEDKVAVFVVSLADKSVRKLTPDTEAQWKEGLEWHPDSQFLTYMIYGPEKLSAQIRRAWLDGRPTDLMIDQPDYWDYLGVWAPDGRRFFFRGFVIASKSVGFTFSPETAAITPNVWDGNLPRWSRDGTRVVWESTGALRYFEVIEDFRR